MGKLIVFEPPAILLVMFPARVISLPANVYPVPLKVILLKEVSAAMSLFVDLLEAVKGKTENHHL